MWIGGGDALFEVAHEGLVDLVTEIFDGAPASTQDHRRRVIGNLTLGLCVTGVNVHIKM